MIPNEILKIIPKSKKNYFILFLSTGLRHEQRCGTLRARLPPEPEDLRGRDLHPDHLHVNRCLATDDQGGLQVHSLGSSHVHHRSGYSFPTFAFASSNANAVSPDRSVQSFKH